MTTGEVEKQERPLGELLVESESITREQLAHALRVQAKLKKKRFGQVLIELGYLSDEEMSILLDRFSRRVRLGDLLVEREFLTPAELEKALEAQKSRPNLKLGEILVKVRYTRQNHGRRRYCRVAQSPGRFTRNRSLPPVFN